MLYLKTTDSKVLFWKLEKIGDGIESKVLVFQEKTKEELSEQLLYFKTSMKLELDRKINDCDLSYITSIIEKKVCLSS